jgi:hypothetical protein
MSWFSNTSCNGSTILPSSTEFLYFAYIILDIEEEHEESLGIWKALVDALKVEGSVLDQCVKQVSKDLKLSRIDTNFLSIYRWSKQFLDATDEADQMQLAYAQRFLRLYLARPEPNEL